MVLQRKKKTKRFSSTSEKKNLYFVRNMFIKTRNTNYKWKSFVQTKQNNYQKTIAYARFEPSFS